MSGLRQTRLRLLPLWLLLSLPCAAFVVRCAVQWQVPLPFCLLRTLTGIPCPACGCTRSLLAWAHLEPAAALRFNPLFFAGCVAIVAWGMVGTVNLWMRWEWPGRLEATVTRAATLRPAMVLAAFNWLYLCLHSPK